MHTTNSQEYILSTSSLDRFIDHYLSQKQEDVEFLVEKFRNDHPDLTDLELARKLRNKMATRSGWYGAATGIGNMMSVPLTSPISLLTSWKLQIKLILAIAYVFGKKPDINQLKKDVYLLLARQAFSTATRDITLQAAKMLFAAQLRKNLAKMQVKVEEKMKEHHKKVPVKSKAPDLGKIAAFAGAPLGFANDYYATRQVGKMAIKYFRKD